MKTKNQAELPSFPSEDAIKKELRRENYKHLYVKVLKSTLYTLIIVAAVAVLIATMVLPVVQISGTSMEPTLNNKDIVVLVKTKYLQRGDLCAFSYSNKVLIKRVIGLPGDYVDIDADGNVFINGKQIEEPYVINKSLGNTDIEFPYQVPESQYFMMGDHRDTSVDSRNTIIGCITKEQMIGRILFKIWPFSGDIFVD